MEKSNAGNAKRAKPKPDPKQRYLDAIAKGHAGREAVKKARISYHTVLAWRDEDPDFAAAEADAKEQLADKLEAITATVAMKQDHPQATTNRIFLLKALRPEKFRERISAEHSGPGGGAIPVKHDFSQLSDEELNQFERLAEKTATPRGDSS